MKVSMSVSTGEDSIQVQVDLQEPTEKTFADLGRTVYRQLIGMRRIKVPQKPVEPGVFITNSGLNKILVIKAVREATLMGLVDAKNLVEAVSAGTITKVPDLRPDQFEFHATRLRAAGATVEVRGAPRVRNRARAAQPVTAQ